MNTEKEDKKYEPYYLYQTANKQWWIGDQYGMEDGLLKNEMKTTGGPEDLPLSEWRVKSVKKANTWEIDPTIKITSGPLTPSCKTIKIEATGPAAEEHPVRLGEFHLSNRWFNGHPIYQNDNGQLLHNMNWHGMVKQWWGIADTLGYSGIRGWPAYLCPSKINKWEYYDGSTWKLGNFTVTCSDY